MEVRQGELDFHNTINESGEKLTELKQNAKTQQEKILWYFFMNKDHAYTPFEIQVCVLPNAPITSIRRAITNLTTQGQLIRTDAKKEEQYGVMNYKWKYNGRNG
jgi:hypothetical protein